jgi:hypothetical protein
MVFEGFIAVWGRPSSATSLHGPSTLPYTTKSKPALASCLLASTRHQNASIQRHPRRVTSLSCGSILGRCTCYLRWPPGRRALSAPFRSGLSKRVSWYAIAHLTPSFFFCDPFVSFSLTYDFLGCSRSGLGGSVLSRHNHATSHGIVTR